MAQEPETTTVEVKTETWAALDRRKQRGESFDDVIQKLINTTPAKMGSIKPMDPDMEPEFDDPEPLDDTDETCVHFDVITGETCGEPADYRQEYTHPNGDSDELHLCEEHA